MDPRLLQAYNDELEYLRETAREFGQEHESVASRLGLKTPNDPDPYVERLLEGVAFLNARVQLKQRDQYPEFTSHLLQAVQPQYLAPTPSFCIAGLEPRPGDPALIKGHVVAKGTELTAIASQHEESPVIFRTGHAVTLWPIEIVETEYLGSRAAVAEYAAAADVRAEAGLRIRFKATGGVDLSQVLPKTLDLYLDGSESIPGELYRQVCGETLAVVGCDPARSAGHVRMPPPVQLGFEDSQALLPAERRSFRGYRLLAEYFACPERFLFVSLVDPAKAFAQASETCDVVLLFSRSSRVLAGAIEPSNLRLFATPCINLFERQLGRVTVSPFEHEHHVVPDRTRPLDFEVYRLLDIQAHSRELGEPRPVEPIYSMGSQLYDWKEALHYTTHLRPRRLSTRDQRRKRRGDYVGTEVWLSLTAPGHAEWLDEISELAVRALVTNRELPALLTFEKEPHFTLDGEPVAGARVLRSPTHPRPPLGLHDAAWRVIGHLTPNYLTLATDEREDAALLRDHLALYGRQDEPRIRRQIDGVRRIRSRPVTRRLPGADRMAVARGQFIQIELEDSGFDDARMFLFAAVVERFLAEFATINSFTETAFESPQEGVFARWPARIGRRHNI